MATASIPSSATGSHRAHTQYPRELRVYSAYELAEATGGFNELCCIGEGGFGKVYRAMVQLTPVAIKVLDHEGLQGLREFHNEMQLLCNLKHPNIVRLLGYAAEGSTQCLVYELMAHGNLEDRLAHKSGVDPLPWPLRVKIAAQTSYALTHLHSKGIIHRDIKPANVFLDCDFNAKLGDIGLAAMDGYYGGRLASSSAGSSAVKSPGGEAIGTWSYLAPEYKLQGRSSTRTDVYAFGLSLLQLLTAAAQPKDLIQACQRALEDCTMQKLLDRSAGEWDTRVAERLVKLALWCCMHDPERRPTMPVLHAQIHRLLQQLQHEGRLEGAGV